MLKITHFEAVGPRLPHRIPRVDPKQRKSIWTIEREGFKERVSSAPQLRQGKAKQ